MIKIIKEGKLRRYRATCPNCGCVFEFDESDITTDEQFAGNAIVTTKYIECPYCKHNVYKEKMELWKI